MLSVAKTLSSTVQYVMRFHFVDDIMFLTRDVFCMYCQTVKIKIYLMGIMSGATLFDFVIVYNTVAENFALC